MYLPDITGAGPLLVGPAFFARQRLDLVPRLLLDVAGATFLVIALLFMKATAPSHRTMMPLE